MRCQVLRFSLPPFVAAYLLESPRAGLIRRRLEAMDLSALACSGTVVAVG